MINIDKTGVIDATLALQALINSFPTYAAITLPSGIYKIVGTVNLKEGQTLTANNDVIITGVSTNLLINVTYKTTVQGIEFQNCYEALSITNHSWLKIINCKFNNIVYAAINFYGGLSNCSVTNSYFNNILKYGILIDNNSHDITIENNCFDNPELFGNYAEAQISGHIYCLNGTNIKVLNNFIRNSGGQGVIFTFNSVTGKGTTNSIASGNTVIGCGQEAITTFGGNDKKSSNNTITDNICKNNRYHQIEVWQSDNNIVKNNIVEESDTLANIGALTLFSTTGTTCINNTIISAQNNGIAIIAGSSNCIVSDNLIMDTNKCRDISTAEKGNGILMDWSGISDPMQNTIENNTITSTGEIINKSGIYSTSNTNHHNIIDENIITGYQYTTHQYAMATCDAIIK